MTTVACNFTEASSPTGPWEGPGDAPTQDLPRNDGGEIRVFDQRLECWKDGGW